MILLPTSHNTTSMTQNELHHTDDSMNFVIMNTEAQYTAHKRAHIKSKALEGLALQ